MLDLWELLVRLATHYDRLPRLSARARARRDAAMVRLFGQIPTMVRALLPQDNESVVIIDLTATWPNAAVTTESLLNALGQVMRATNAHHGAVIPVCDVESGTKACVAQYAITRPKSWDGQIF